jgi:hypothetical protein
VGSALYTIHLPHGAVMRLKNGIAEHMRLQHGSSFLASPVCRGRPVGPVLLVLVGADWWGPGPGQGPGCVQPAVQIE